MVKSLGTSTRPAGRADMARPLQASLAFRFSRRYLFVPVTVALVVWFLFVSYSTYGFLTTTQQLNLHPLVYMVSGLPRNIDRFVLLLCFLFSAIGPGYFVLWPLRIAWRDRWEETLFSLAVGLVLYTFLFLVIGSARLLHLWVCYLVFAAGLCATVAYLAQWYSRYSSEVRRRARAHRATTQPDGIRDQETTASSSWRTVAAIWLVVILIFALYIALLGALSPETQFDARWYHLGPARTYVREDGFINYVKETNMGAADLDVYQVVLYTVLWKFDGMIAAKLMHWGDALLTVLAIIYFCRAHFRSTIMGLLGSVIYITTPVITWSAGTAGNDLQLCLYTLLSVHAFLRWREDMASPKWLVLAGITSGYALGSKWLGLFNLLILLAAIVLTSVWSLRARYSWKALCQRTIIAVAVAGSAAFICCMPWLMRSYAMTGNPLYPYLDSIFKSPYTLTSSAGSSSSHTGLFFSLLHSIAAVKTALWNMVAMKIEYRAIVGPVFILVLPVVLGFLLYHWRTKWLPGLLALYVVLWLFLWNATAAFELRYTEAIIPILSILVAYVLMEARWHHWQGRLFTSALAAMVVIMVLLNTYPFAGLQRGASDPSAFAQPRISWGYLYKGEPEESVQLVYLPMITYINAHLSPDNDKIYDTSNLILYAAYSDIKMYNGSRGIEGAHAWDLLSAKTLVQLNQIGATYASVTSADALKVKQSPTSACFQEVYSTPDDQVLLRIDYARLVGEQTKSCRAAAAR